MNYKKKNKIIIIIAIIMTNLYGSTKYEDSQILNLLENYFKSNSQIIKLGANIYTEKTKRVFQLEITSKESAVEKNLVTAFIALYKISSYAEYQIQKLKLIVHLDHYDVPLVALCNYNCIEKYISDYSLDEKEWRNNCLIIKSL
ncbi:MAG: hypothetical protein CMG62_04960 [Candidatus Marinimicrobia bacterium]|nr:hypothetical protein [Candidatus Neomarinimicrobiota bacterium]|tara:strand:- start:4517 stop:4948 length:432 start_codon:yes stop_codon:yes gene_type:complete